MSENKSRISQLDGLRGYAALSVVVYHTVLVLDSSQASRLLYTKFTEIDGLYNYLDKIVLMLFNGELAVDLFFILSGAVLFDSFRKDSSAFPGASIRFLVRRFFRIYPALFVCLLTAYAVFLVFGRPVTFRGLIENLLLYDTPINGATWTLQVEFLASALLLVIFFAGRVGGELALILIGFGLIFLLKQMPLLPASIVTFWICFALGAAIPTRFGSLLAAFAPKWSWLIAIAAMIIFRSDLQRVSAAVLVTLLYYDKAGWLGEFLRRPISLFFGRISYSVYLFNPIILLIPAALSNYAWVNQHPLEVGLPLSIVVVGMTIPIAYLSTRMIENPFIDLGRRLTAKHKTSPRDGDVSAVKVAN